LKPPNYASALANFQQYKAFSDSLLNEGNIREVANATARQEMRLRELEQQIAAEDAQAAQDRRDRLQYFAALVLICVLATVGLLLMRIKLAPWAGQMMLFVLVLLIFEFLLVLLDPTLDRWVNGAPLPKLGLNTLLALVIAPVHGWLMRRLVGRTPGTNAHVLQPEPGAGPSKEAGTEGGV
jgi:hypothetical protein